MSYLDRSLEERRKNEAIRRRHVLTPEEMDSGRKSLERGNFTKNLTRIEEKLIESERLEEERIEMEERYIERLIEEKDISQLLPIEEEEVKIKKKKSLFDF